MNSKLTKSRHIVLADGEKEPFRFHLIPLAHVSPVSLGFVAQREGRQGFALLDNPITRRHFDTRVPVDVSIADDPFAPEGQTDREPTHNPCRQLALKPTLWKQSEIGGETPLVYQTGRGVVDEPNQLHGILSL